MIYLDQPIGTGYSYSDQGLPDYLHLHESWAMQEVLVFIRAFFVKFPHLLNGNFWMFGESYGGKYMSQVK